MIKFKIPQWVFVQGKGGVGKTTFTYACAEALADKRQVLVVKFDNPDRKEHEWVKKKYHDLNCSVQEAFEQYVKLKIRFPGGAKLFTSNSAIRFLATQSPGMKELLLLGKVWHESHNYDVVLVDMPATGHGLAYFHSLMGLGKLFKGPIATDAASMLADFGDPEKTLHCVITLPEEMPLEESTELTQKLKEYFPHNPSILILNQSQKQILENPQEEESTLRTIGYIRSLRESRLTQGYNFSFKIPRLQPSETMAAMVKEWL